MLDHQNVTTRSGVSLYDQEQATARFPSATPPGNSNSGKRAVRWRKTWSHVVGGFASGISVLFYQESTGHCEIYQLNYDPTAEETDDPPAGGSGANSLGVMAAAELPPGATIIVGGSFGLDFGFVAYLPELGRLQFLFMVQNSDQKTFSIDTQEFYDGLGGQWDLIASGGFWTPDEEDYSSSTAAFRACCSTTGTRDAASSTCTRRSDPTRTHRSPDTRRAAAFGPENQSTSLSAVRSEPLR